MLTNKHTLFYLLFAPFSALLMNDTVIPIQNQDSFGRAWQLFRVVGTKNIFEDYEDHEISIDKLI